jgi:hypothetical protein
MTKPPGAGKSGLTGGRCRERGALSDDAVVVTVTVIFVAELLGVSVVGATVHVAFEGAPVQVRLTLWLNPPWPATAKVYVADCPAETVADEEDPDGVARVKS